jgi:hypothetical protein
MAELVTVYKALPDEVTKIVQLLQSRNLNPVVIDDIGKMGAYRSHVVRIAVPETERDMAVGVLAEADLQNQARLSSVIKGTNAVVFIVIIFLAALAIAGFVDESGKWFNSIWILFSTIIAVALIRWAWCKKT